ncbi:MAG TPA: sulfite exporter TauE/SafE family protein [Candidatus Obscuribacterales bacterium]
MSHIGPVSYLILAAASFLAGGINAVAGGGTILTFPTLLACGITPVVANATNTIALVPASLAGAYSFRKELPNLSRTIKLFALPSIIGGFVGAKLMLLGGDHLLSMLVPWLILAASTLFLLQEPISRLAAKRAQQKTAATHSEQSKGTNPEDAHLQNVPAVIIFMFLVAVYGGYFGAGIGILTLAALGFLGMTNIHQMNGVKNILTASINLVATITFIMAGRIDGLIALLMSCGTILGALSSAGVALKLGQRRVRQLIIIIGFGITALMFYRQAHGGL